MPPPYHPRDIVRVVASVDRTLRSFFYDNSRLSAMPGTTEAAKSSPLDPDAPLASALSQYKGGPARPGVILDLSTDSATVAMFTTLQGKGISEVKGVLRPIMARILPANSGDKHDPAASGWLPTLAVHPTWYTPSTAKQTLCLCLKHEVPVEELEPWVLRREPATAGQRFRMCKDDFKLLQQLCEKNEGLRGLFAPKSWLFEEFSLVDFMKRRD